MIDDYRLSDITFDDCRYAAAADDIDYLFCCCYAISR